MDFDKHEPAVIGKSIRRDYGIRKGNTAERLNRVGVELCESHSPVSIRA